MNKEKVKEIAYKKSKIIFHPDINDFEQEFIEIGELNALLDQFNDAEPHLFNIAGHMMDYKNSGTLNEYDLIDLIDRELNAFYNKEEKHPILEAFDEKAKEYINYESTSLRLKEIRKVIVKVIEEEQVKE